MSGLQCASWDIGVLAQYPFAPMEGDGGTIVAGLNGTFHALELVGFAWQETGGGNVLDPATDKHWYNEDFKVTFIPEDAEWSAWLPSQVSSAHPLYAIGFLGIVGSVSFKMILWTVDFTDPINPVFTLRATGSTTLTQDVEYRFSYRIDDTGNNPIEIWIQPMGDSAVKEIDYAGVSGLHVSKHTALYNREVGEGKTIGDVLIKHDSPIWNDEINNGDGMHVRQGDNVRVIGHQPLSDLIGANNWVPDPLDSHRKYFMVCDFNRTGSPGGNDRLDATKGGVQGFGIVNKNVAGTVRVIMVYGSGNADPNLELCIVGDSDANLFPLGSKGVFRPKAPDGNVWTNAHFNELQARLLPHIAGYYERFCVEVCGVDIVKPAASADGVGNQVDNCPAIPVKREHGQVI